LSKEDFTASIFEFLKEKGVEPEVLTPEQLVPPVSSSFRKVSIEEFNKRLEEGKPVLLKK